MMKNKKKKRWIKRAVYMAQTGYSNAEFRAFALTLRDLRMIDNSLIADMNAAFCKELSKFYNLDRPPMKKE